MFDIIPNWHPILVHFSIGLLVSAAIFHLLVLIVGGDSKKTLTIVANWNLWAGAGISVLTVIAGWIAFNSVNHDTPSHLVMLTHRKWAIGTLIVFIAIAAWSFLRAKKALSINIALTLSVVVAAGLLLVTAWYGGELVYRHGLGVMSLPQQGQHDHADGHAHSHDNIAPADEYTAKPTHDEAHSHESGDSHTHADDHHAHEGQAQESVADHHDDKAEHQHDTEAAPHTHEHSDESKPHTH